MFLNLLFPLSSDRQHLSYDGCLEVRRGDYHNCPVLFCVLKLCTVIRTLRTTILTVLWVLSHWAHVTVRRFICVYPCVFFVFLFHTA